MARSSRSRRPTGRRRPYLVAAALVTVTAFVIGGATFDVIQRWQEQNDATMSDLNGDGAGESGSAPGVTLYYVAEDGRGLVAQPIALASGGDALARARVIVERQLEAPPNRLMSPFPDGTTLRALYLADDGNAFVDLSREVTTGHSGGSLDELFTVYALVNALTTNVPEIAAVQIIIDGREVDTLAGHIDLRQPLAPSMTWVIDPDAEPDADLGDTDPADPDAASPPPAS